MVPTARLYLEDYMKIQPGDSPAIVLLKKLATIDSTELKKNSGRFESGKETLTRLHLSILQDQGSGFDFPLICFRY